MHQVQLSIPEPCHEDWNQMTPTQQGRHCSACAKQVIDFSTMSDAQVLNYFTNIKNENVCGRVYPDQLERAIAMPITPRKRLFWKWNYITMLFLFFSKNNTAKAQGGVKVVTAAQLDNIKPVYTNELLVGKVINSVQTINGTIKDVDGKPIAFASIRVKGKTNGIAADVNGSFSIQVDTRRDVLQIGSAGYIQKEAVLNGSADYNFVLAKSDTKDNVIFMAGMMIPRHFVKVEAINIEVKDNANYEPVDKATIIVKKVADNKTDTVFTSGKGIYKIKKVQQNESFEIKVAANGYKEQTINVQAASFDAKEITKQIFLEKEPSLADYKKLDSVVVNTFGTTGKLVCTTLGGVSWKRTTKRIYTDTLKTIVTKITGDLKIFPNPVQKGNAINLSFKLKQTGAYNIQIINAAGQMLLSKQLQPSSKNYTEQVQTNASWSGGIYYVRLLNEKNQLISTNSFVIQ